MHRSRLQHCEPPQAGTPPSARLGHSQLVAAGYLYVFGGRQPTEPGVVYDGNEVITSLNDTHRLELATGRWEELACTGDIPSGRSYCAMALSPGSPSTLYLFGGMIDSARHNDLYTFDTVTSTYTRLVDGPMEGRGGAGLCTAKGSLWVLAGFCGRPVGDVWEYSIGGEAWVEHTEMQLAVPRSIFACFSGNGTLTVFGGELTAAAGHAEAGVYTNEVLSIDISHGAGACGGAVTVVPVGGAEPAARGWTSGCRVEYRDRTSSSASKRTGFAVFGGIGPGRKGGAPGVRLGDLVILE